MQTLADSFDLVADYWALQKNFDKTRSVFNIETLGSQTNCPVATTKNAPNNTSSPTDHVLVQHALVKPRVSNPGNEIIDPRFVAHMLPQKL